MLLPPVARKRIGLSPFCVRRAWSISSASLRNLPTTITTRRFPRSSTRCGSRDRRKNQRREDAPARSGRETSCFGSFLSWLLLPAVTVAEEKWQNRCAFFADCLEFTRVDPQHLQNGSSNLRSAHRCLDRLGVCKLRWPWVQIHSRGGFPGGGENFGPCRGTVRQGEGGGL